MPGEPLARAEGRRRRLGGWAAALLLVVVAGTAYLAGTDWLPPVRLPLAPGTSAPATGAAPAPTPVVNPAALRLQALDELLAARSGAVMSRDLDAWMATVDPRSPRFAERQGAVFANLEAVPLAEWRYEYAGDGPALSPERSALLGPDAWVARTVLVYRLAGSDLGEVRRQQDLTLVRRGERWLVAGDGDGRSAVDLWDLGPVQVVRGSRSLVLGTAAADVLRRYADGVDRAAVVVDGVWGTGWARTVVVLVPRSQHEMARLLGRDDEVGLEQIAAVTTGELAPEPFATSADRVVVNPGGFSRLGDLGRQVVLRHEITHVATRATTTAEVPIWLSEGFADYVAYRDTGVSRAVVAQDVLELVRAGQAPSALPGHDDFDPAQGDVAAAYASAWLAADLVQRRWGEQALIDLYRAVASGVPTGEAFPQVLRIEEAAFVREWQGYLAEAAS